MSLIGQIKQIEELRSFFGPVMDPQGVYGIGVYRAADEAEMRDLIDHDPAQKLLKYHVLPMPRAVVGVLSP